MYTGPPVSSSRDDTDVVHRTQIAPRLEDDKFANYSCAETRTNQRFASAVRDARKLCAVIRFYIYTKTKLVLFQNSHAFTSQQQQRHAFLQSARQHRERAEEHNRKQPLV